MAGGLGGAVGERRRSEDRPLRMDFGLGGEVLKGLTPEGVSYSMGIDDVLMGGNLW